MAARVALVRSIRPLLQRRGVATTAAAASSAAVATTGASLRAELDKLERFSPDLPEETAEVLMTPEVRADIAAISTAEDALIATIDTTDVSVDWNEWSSKIVFPGLVDKFRQSHASITPEDSSELAAAAVADAEAALRPLQKEADAAAESAKTVLETVDAHLADATWFAESVGELTTAEFCERYPATAAAADEGVRAEAWALTDPAEGVSEAVAAMSEKEAMDTLNAEGEEALIAAIKQSKDVKALTA